MSDDLTVIDQFKYLKLSSDPLSNHLQENEIKVVYKPGERESFLILFSKWRKLVVLSIIKYLDYL